MASCEMCGRELYSKPIKIEIEGAVLEVCPACAKHGKKVTPSKPKPTRVSNPSIIQKQVSQPKYPSRAYKPSNTEDNKELVIDFHDRVRLARQKMKLTQKEVSIQTKISVQELQSIETGKMRPSDTLISKLEKFYNIKLVETIKAYSPKDQIKAPGFQTLGDIVVIKKKKDEE